MKMSKSSQTEKSITELEATIKENAKRAESEYDKLREELRIKYAPEKESYYWKK